MIDTHAHIQSRDVGDVDKVINNAKENGVSKIICVGYDVKSSIEAVELADKYKEVYAIIGVHPSEVEYVESNYIETLKILKYDILEEKYIDT